jgi:predicted deacetylase
MPVHVSIHDVTPAWAREVDEALELCAAVGARPALLVVPDFHGRWPLLADEPFCQRLRGLQARGHEVYLHGLRHRGRDRYDGSGPSRLSWFLAQRVLSGGEAEMSDVSPEEGRARLDQGERTLREAGLRIDGFVPPAWSMPRWLPALLAARGYRFTEDHVRVYDPAAGRARFSVVLNWASRSPARLLSTVAWCRTARHARAVVPARIAIHPGDMNFLLLRREVARLLAWAQGDIVAKGRDLLEAGASSAPTSA